MAADQDIKAEPEEVADQDIKAEPEVVVVQVHKEAAVVILDIK